VLTGIFPSSTCPVAEQPEDLGVGGRKIVVLPLRIFS